jgi:hypothetical protein
MDHELGSMTLRDEERRLLAFWVADCAERTLALFEAQAPADIRPRAAIEGTRAFAAGARRTARLRALVWAAYAAARAAGDPAATAAARAAGSAAGIAYMHDLVTPDQVKHVLAPGMYAARARELAAGGDPRAGEEEIHWAIAYASPAVCEIIRWMPVRSPGRSRQDALLYQLDAGLRR